MSRLPNFPSPFSAYYDPNPQRKLEHPLVVCSFFGGQGAAIAKRIAAIAGWPYVDIYEETAHRLGHHRASSSWDAERAEWSTTQQAVLARALQDEPNPVIGLPDGCWLRSHTLSLIEDCADVVFIDLDWLTLQENLLDEIVDCPERHPEFANQPIPDLHTLQHMYKLRAPLYALAKFRLPTRRLATTSNASNVLKMLDANVMRQTIR